MLHDGDVALGEFRDRLTGRYGLELLRRHRGRVLVQLVVGVGKSIWMDAVTRAAVEGGDYDLVAVLCPTRLLLEEREPLHHPPDGVRVVNLRPRPTDLCGPGRDARWRRCEAADLGALGRVEICGTCPVRHRCFWPGQYGQGLRGARIVYATQAHLERNPNFLLTLRSWAGAQRMLTLLDEANFIGTPRERVVTATDLRQFADVLTAASRWRDDLGSQHQHWVALVNMLLDASTDDLQAPSWRAPRVRSRWALLVQDVGVQRYGDQFHFLGYDLGQFARSPRESRHKDAAGDVRFAVRPYVGDCMIFSGTTDLAFTRHRLGIDLASPFAGYRFSNPGTRWYNLASPLGSRKYFARHAPQILDFFAGLVVRRAAAGKRVLLVAKKALVELCARGLAERFARACGGLRVITSGWSAGLLADPSVVPVITYGLIGVNLFEHFDAAYCLTAYYVNEPVVNACLQDVTRWDLRLPIEITTQGHPRRRLARVIDPDHRYYDVAPLVQPALEFQEHNVVVQAVGRVRPFTRPREVITFQMAELPGVTYDAEFSTLAQAREFFAVTSRREQKRADLAARIAALRCQGVSQAETAVRLGVSERTVRNYEKRRTGNFPS
jgi:hypothetical protein